MSVQAISSAGANTAEQEPWVPMIAIALGQMIMSFNVASLPVALGGMVKSFDVPPTTVDHPGRTPAKLHSWRSAERSASEESRAWKDKRGGRIGADRLRHGIAQVQPCLCASVM
jgi:hypothetical protein